MGLIYVICGLAFVVGLVVSMLVVIQKEVGVIKRNDRYFVYRKYKRVFGSDIEWSKYYYNAMLKGSSNWDDGTYNTEGYSKEEALKIAKYFDPCKKESRSDGELIWKSEKPKKNRGIIPEEEELTLQLGNALRAGDKELELKLMSELKQYKYI